MQKYTKVYRSILRMTQTQLLMPLMATNFFFFLYLIDVILIALDSTSYKPHDNLSVVGNKMIYNEDSVVTAFAEPVIHSYNKGLTSLTRYPQLVRRLKVIT